MPLHPLGPGPRYAPAASGAAGRVQRCALRGPGLLPWAVQHNPSSSSVSARAHHSDSAAASSSSEAVQPSPIPQLSGSLGTWDCGDTNPRGYVQVAPLHETPDAAAIQAAGAEDEEEWVAEQAEKRQRPTWRPSEPQQQPRQQRQPQQQQQWSYQPHNNNNQQQQHAHPRPGNSTTAFKRQLHNCMDPPAIHTLLKGCRLRDLTLLHIGITCTKLLQQQDHWLTRRQQKKKKQHQQQAGEGAASQQKASRQGLRPPRGSPAASAGAALVLDRLGFRLQALLPLSPADAAEAPARDAARALVAFLTASAECCHISSDNSRLVQLVVEQYLTCLQQLLLEVRSLQAAADADADAGAAAAAAAVAGGDPTPAAKGASSSAPAAAGAFPGTAPAAAPAAQEDLEQLQTFICRTFNQCCSSLAVLEQLKVPLALDWATLQAFSLQLLPWANKGHMGSMLWVWRKGALGQQQQQQLRGTLQVAAGLLVEQGGQPYVDRLWNFSNAAEDEGELEFLMSCFLPGLLELLPGMRVMTIMSALRCYSKLRHLPSALLGPACTVLLGKDLRRDSTDALQLLATTLEGLPLESELLATAAGPEQLQLQQVQQYVKAVLASKLQPRDPQLSPWGQTRQQTHNDEQQQQNRAPDQQRRAVGRIKQLLQHPRVPLQELSAVLRQAGHLLDLYGLGYVHYQTLATLQRRGLGAGNQWVRKAARQEQLQRGQQQQREPSTQSGGQQQLSGGGDGVAPVGSASVPEQVTAEATQTHMQQQLEQEQEDAAELLQVLEGLVDGVLPLPAGAAATAPAAGRTALHDQLLALSSMLHAWVRCGYQPAPATLHKVVEQYMVLLQQLMETGAVEALLKQQQVNQQQQQAEQEQAEGWERSSVLQDAKGGGPGSGWRATEGDGAPPSSTDTSSTNGSSSYNSRRRSSSNSSSSSSGSSGGPPLDPTKLCRSFCNLVWALSKLHRRCHWWHSLTPFALQLAPLLAPRDTSTMLYAWAAAGQADVVLFARLASVAERQLTLFEPQGLANLLWAYATAGQYNQRLFQSAASHVLRLLPSANPQALCNALWAYAKAGVCPLGFLEVATEQLRGLDFLNFKPQELATTSWALARLQRVGAPIPFIGALQAKIAAVAVEKLDTFKLIDFMSLMVGQTYNDAVYQPLLQAAARRLLVELQESNADLTAVMPALHVLAKATFEEPLLISRLLQLSKQQAPQLARDGQACSMLLASLSFWRYRDDHLLDVLAEAIQAAVPGNSAAAAADASGYGAVSSGLYSLLLSMDASDSTTAGLEGDYILASELDNSSGSSSTADGSSQEGEDGAADEVSQPASATSSSTTLGEATVLLDWSLQALTIACVSIARVGYSQPQHLQLFRQLVDAMLTTASSCTRSHPSHQQLLSSSVQVLWACAVMDVREEVLLSQLLQVAAGASQQHLADVQLGQLHQVHMFLQMLPSSKRLLKRLPGPLWTSARTYWLQMAQRVTVSAQQREVAQQLQALGLPSQVEQRTRDNCFSVDVAVQFQGQQVAVEVMGPEHYVVNAQLLQFDQGAATAGVLRAGSKEQGVIDGGADGTWPGGVQLEMAEGAGYLVLLGPECFRMLLLEARGWRVMPISVYELTQARAQSDAAMRQLLLSRLEALTAEPGYASSQQQQQQRAAASRQGGRAGRSVAGRSSSRSQQSSTWRGAATDMDAKSRTRRGGSTQQQQGWGATSMPGQQQQQQAWAAVSVAEADAATAVWQQRTQRPQKAQRQALAAAAAKVAAGRGKRACKQQPVRGGTSADRRKRGPSQDAAGGDRLEEFELELDDLFAAADDTDPSGL